MKMKGYMRIETKLLWVFFASHVSV